MTGRHVLISGSFEERWTTDRDGEGELECSGRACIWTFGCWLPIFLVGYISSVFCRKQG